MLVFERAVQHLRTYFRSLETFIALERILKEKEIQILG